MIKNIFHKYNAIHAGARGVGDAIMEHQEEVRQQNRDRPPESRRATQYDTKEEALAQASAWANEYGCEVPVNEVNFNKGQEGAEPDIRYVISPWVNNTATEAYIPPEISAISTKQWHFALATPAAARLAIAYRVVSNSENR